MSWTGGSAGADQLQRTVTKTATGSTTITCKAGPNGTQWSVTIVVVDIVESASPDPDSNRRLWYFNGTSGGSGYPLQMTLTAVGTTTGTFEWTVTVGYDKAYFAGSGLDVETRNNDNTVQVNSCGASTSVGDVTISLRINGAQVGTHAVTVSAPQHCILAPNVNPNPVDGTWLSGFSSVYWMQVLDMFSGVMPAAVNMNESFAIPWDDDYKDPDHDWPEPNAVGCMTTASGIFPDNYRASCPAGTPVSIAKPTTGWNTVPIFHTTQYYKAGTQTIGGGRIFSTHTVQFYQGSGAQE